MAVLMIVDDDPAAADRIAELRQNDGFAVARADVAGQGVAETAQRIRSHLGQAARREPKTLRAGKLSADLVTRKVRRGTRWIELSPREFDVLAYLLRHANRIVDRAALFEAIWNF